LLHGRASTLSAQELRAQELLRKEQDDLDNHMQGLYDTMAVEMAQIDALEDFI